MNAQKYETPKKSPAVWMVRYFNSDGVAADCHADTFETETEARAQGAKDMRHLDWAVRFEVYRDTSNED